MTGPCVSFDSSGISLPEGRKITFLFPFSQREARVFPPFAKRVFPFREDFQQALGINQTELDEEILRVPPLPRISWRWM